MPERCGLCGGPDQRHRMVEAQMGRVRDGETLAEVSDDYGLTPEQMVSEWSDRYELAYDYWDRLDNAVRRVLADEESAEGGWGPDVTTVKYLKEALEGRGSVRPHLFHLAEVGTEFRLHSGQPTAWMVDVDGLTDVDLLAVADWLSAYVGPFGAVEGVPRGGLRLAKAMEPLADGESGLLLVDDVLTSGASLESHRRGRDARGAVLFARGPVPSWVTALWSLPTAR